MALKEFEADYDLDGTIVVVTYTVEPDDETDLDGEWTATIIHVRDEDDNISVPTQPDSDNILDWILENHNFDQDWIEDDSDPVVNNSLPENPAPDQELPEDPAPTQPDVDAPPSDPTVEQPTASPNPDFDPNINPNVNPDLDVDPAKPGHLPSPDAPAHPDQELPPSAAPKE